MNIESRQGLPILDMEGFCLRRIQLDDAIEWARFEMLPEVGRYTSFTVRSSADLVPLIERDGAPGPGGLLNFAVWEAAGSQLAGVVGFHSISKLNLSAEVSYSIHPRFWGKGLATASVQAAVRWGFASRSWSRVQGTSLPENVASRRVLDKAGFSYEGRLRNLRVVRGVVRDYLLYSIIPSVQTPAGSPDAGTPAAITREAQEDPRACEPSAGTARG